MNKLTNALIISTCLSWSSLGFTAFNPMTSAGTAPKKVKITITVNGATEVYLDRTVEPGTTSTMYYASGGATFNWEGNTLSKSFGIIYYYDRCPSKPNRDSCRHLPVPKQVVINPSHASPDEKTHVSVSLKPCKMKDGTGTMMVDSVISTSPVAHIEPTPGDPSCS